MPRVENLGAAVDAYHEATGNGSSTWDLCRRCAATLRKVPNIYNAVLIPYNGDPEGDERGGEVVHPPYEEWEYECEICRKPLGPNDD